ncbi:hypothetical protein Fmac_006503 [Flemingia macrophylla]|uniref:Uncharacterized protein n=1 Tax=Flemingia macrophylla TaxID=520843 RepID=A0ABD1NBA3_9FABA
MGLAVRLYLFDDPEHMMAMKIINQAHERKGKMKSFTSYCGGLPSPEAANNPLAYKFKYFLECAHNFSKDHKPGLEAEKDMILKAGGFIQVGRVNGSLNLARAIGTRDYFVINSNVQKNMRESLCTKRLTWSENDVHVPNIWVTTFNITPIQDQLTYE